MGADRIKSQTDANQRKAADPGASVWVSASAGTGKTSVLISRLERLLLQGVRPERILCLTYTNAAAAEMQNRLYAELKDWAAMEGEVLAARLRALTGADADESVMARARQLFTLTLETKGGLKIHTIHGFCERLLDEAYVSLIPGSGFGMDNYVRISFATSLEQLEKGMDRIEDWLHKNG